jgi:hypothetical protein
MLTKDATEAACEIFSRMGWCYDVKPLSTIEVNVPPNDEYLFYFIMGDLV